MERGLQQLCRQRLVAPHFALAAAGLVVTALLVMQLRSHQACRAWIWSWWRCLDQGSFCVW
jgi:hypothetical protein